MAGFVLLLPAAYLALIAAVGWGVYRHFAENVGLLSLGRGRGRILMAAIYVLPGLAGGAAILALLKPLAAREGGRDPVADAAPQKPADAVCLGRPRLRGGEGPEAG